MIEKKSEVVSHSLVHISLHSEIVFSANREAVWATLTDFTSYRQWNPVITSAKGCAAKGDKLRVVIHWPGLKATPYSLEVLVARAPEELRWLGHYKIPGLMDGDHSFLIAQAGHARVKVVQKEHLTGLLVPLFSPWLKSNVLNGFELLNEALARRVMQYLA